MARFSDAGDMHAAALCLRVQNKLRGVDVFLIGGIVHKMVKFGLGQGGKRFHSLNSFLFQHGINLLFVCGMQFHFRISSSPRSNPSNCSRCISSITSARCGRDGCAPICETVIVAV